MNKTILDFGAVGDGTTDNTQAFADAISACLAEGGGYVDVPPGKFVSGSIELKSNVFLRLSPGAEILGSERWDDYRGVSRGCAYNQAIMDLVKNQGLSECRALIFADRAINTGIIGHGIIDGRRSHTYGYDDIKGRPFLAVFSECVNITLEDITLKNPGMYAVYNLNNTRVTVRGIRILSKDSMNGDGIDFDGSKDVVISDCYLETGDDSISLKSLTPREACENFTISNCIFHSQWAGIRLGPESVADMRGLVVSNCVFEDCNDGIKLQVCDDAIFENLIFSNLNMRNVNRPIFITVTSFLMSEYYKSVRPSCGILRHVLFQNIIAHMGPAKKTEFYTIYSNNLIYAMPGAVIEDIVLDNLMIYAKGSGTKKDALRVNFPEILDYTESYPETLPHWGDYPSAGLTIRNVNNIILQNCGFNFENYDERYAIAAEKVNGLVLDGVACRNAGGLLRHIECNNYQIKGEKDTASEVVWEITGELANQWQKTQKAADEMNQKFSIWANQVDKALTMPTALLLTAYDQMKIEGTFIWNGETAMLYVPRFMGRLELKVNGKEAGKCEIPPEYWCKTHWACDITPWLRQGKNSICLECLSSPQEIDIYSEKLALGFFAPAEIKIS